MPENERAAALLSPELDCCKQVYFLTFNKGVCCDFKSKVVLNDSLQSSNVEFYFHCQVQINPLSQLLVIPLKTFVHELQIQYKVTTSDQTCSACGTIALIRLVMQVSFNKPADYQSVYRGQTDRSIETTDKNPESTAVTLNEIKKKILKTEFMGFCFSI